jgi:hypothetical protein
VCYLKAREALNVFVHAPLPQQVGDVWNRQAALELVFLLLFLPLLRFYEAMKSYTYDTQTAKEEKRGKRK